MKTLRYILAGIMLIIIIPLCNSQTSVKSKQVMTVRSVNESAAGKLLSESGEILQRRFECMGLRDISITQNVHEQELVITTGDTVSPVTLSELTLARGQLVLCETMSRKDVLKCFGKELPGGVRDALDAMQATDSRIPETEPILGRSTAGDTASIASCFRSKEAGALLPLKSGFLWSRFPDSDGKYFLYCISSSDGTLNETDVREAHADFKDPSLPELCLTFHEKVWKQFENITVRNMNKPLAIIIDGEVYAAPRILGKISGGKIALTGGGFSKTEVRKLAAIISGGALPLKFSPVSN
jgi:hypothetical protein